MIEQRRQEISQTDAPKRNDLLQILFSLADDDGNKLTDAELMGQVRLFMVAGHETTSMAMTWTILLLAKYPHFQEKARDEIKQFLEADGDVTVENLSKIKYLDNCIKEAMRLYPPAIGVDRILSKDIEIASHCIPKGTSIAIRFNSAQRDGKYWKDPDTFNPDRYEEEGSLQYTA